MSLVKVLSLNVYSHYLVSAPNRGERLKCIADIIIEKDFDIICIQELFLLKIGFTTVSKHLDIFSQTLKEAGYNHTIPTESLPRFLGQNCGLLIFSKFPILSSHSEIFDYSSLTEYPNNKGFISIDIEINNKPIVVCTTHLDAHSPQSRLPQLEQIFNYLKKRKDENNQILLMGDLNIPTNSSEYLHLEDTCKQLGLRDVVHIEKTHIYGATLDHLFISNDFSLNKKAASFWESPTIGMLSDHAAMEFSLQLS